MSHQRGHLWVLPEGRQQERLSTKSPSWDPEGLALVQETHPQIREAGAPRAGAAKSVTKLKGSSGTNGKRHLCHTEALGTPRPQLAPAKSRVCLESHLTHGSQENLPKVQLPSPAN